LGGILISLALLGAACGDDDSDDSSADDAESAVSEAVDDAETAVSEAVDDAETEDTSGGDDDGEMAEPSGDPVKVMTIAPVNSQLPPYPNIQAAAEVYEQYVNDRGGVAGRPLEMIFCDDQGDPNVAADCARQGVEEGVVAVVGSFVFDASGIISVLEEANTAWFGACCPLVTQEFQSEISYPLGSLLPGQGAGNGWKMAQDGCENVVALYIDIPAGDAAHPAVLNAYEVGGGDPANVRVVKIPITAQDYSAQVAEALGGGTDCIAGGISDSNWATWLPGMIAAGAEGVTLYGLQGNLNGVIAEPTRTSPGRCGTTTTRRSWSTRRTPTSTTTAWPASAPGRRSRPSSRSSTAWRVTSTTTPSSRRRTRPRSSTPAG
jgi:hypothetical protein